jgi:hypothetical protein
VGRQVIKLQAVWHGVLGRRYAKEYKNHVSATKLRAQCPEKLDGTGLGTMIHGLPGLVNIQKAIENDHL